MGIKRSDDMHRADKTGFVPDFRIQEMTTIALQCGHERGSAVGRIDLEYDRHAWCPKNTPISLHNPYVLLRPRIPRDPAATHEH